MGLSPGTPVYRFHRLRFADDTPMALEYCTVPAFCLPSADAVDSSLYAALERAAKGKLTRLARGRSADVPLSQAMQEQLPLFARLNLRVDPDSELGAHPLAVQQLVAIARAVDLDAKVLILDEPTSSLDPVITDQLLRVLVEDFANNGRTIFMSSHHLSEVEKIADWVGIIDNGRLLLEARLDDIRSTYRRIRVTGERVPSKSPEILTTSSSEGVTEYVLCAGEEKFVADLRNNGAIVLEVLPMNLSEIFLELAGKENQHVPVETMA